MSATSGAASPAFSNWSPDTNGRMTCCTLLEIRRSKATRSDWNAQSAPRAQLRELFHPALRGVDDPPVLFAMDRRTLADGELILLFNESKEERSQRLVLDDSPPPGMAA